MTPPRDGARAAPRTDWGAPHGDLYVAVRNGQEPWVGAFPFRVRLRTPDATVISDGLSLLEQGTNRAMNGTCKHASICGRDAREGHDGKCILHADDPGKNGAQFEMALEEHWKEHGADFRKIVFPVDVDFSNTTFRTEVDFSDTTFLREADFANAVFEEKVSFRSVVFRGEARFSGADYEKEADFSEADLEEADFSNTDLSRADLAGADLTGATLPEDMDQFEGLVRVGEASQYARSLFFVVLTVCAYSWLAIGTTSDVDLFKNTTTTPLPFIGAEISIVGFYVVAPLVLLVLYLYFHLQLQRLWEEVARLPARFPDGQPLDKKTDPWLLLGLARTHSAHLQEDRLPFFWLQRCVAHLVAWWTVPITLVLFCLRYVARRDPYVTSVHILLILVATILATSFYHKAATTLRGRDERPFEWGKAWTDERVVLPVAFIVLTVALYGVGRWAEITKPNLSGADLRGVNLEATYFPTPLGGVDFGGADLRYSTLSGAKLEDADLAKAQLDSADLSGADLDSTRLSGADLGSTILRKADLSKTPSLIRAKNLEKATLSRAHFDSTRYLGSVDLSGANLDTVKLRNANLTNTNLSGASLRRVRLDSADLAVAALSDANLFEAKMRNAELTKAELESTHLRGADLEGAQLERANLSNAILSNANLSDANLSDANLSDAELDSTNFSGAILRGADVTPDSLCQAATLERAKLNESVTSSICRKCPETFGPPKTYAAGDPRRCGR